LLSPVQPWLFILTVLSCLCCTGSPVLVVMS
jgi:hypothetical protein